MRISRSGFVENLRGKKVDLEKLQENDEFSDSALRHLASADLNRDGFVAGNEEADRLFSKLDDFDRDGNRNTVTPTGAALRLHKAVEDATASSRPAPNTPAGRFQELLTENPGLETNQDLINLFMRRNQFNYGAAAAEAERFGVNMNDLVGDRDGQIQGVEGGEEVPSPTPPAPTERVGRVIGSENTTASFRQKVSEIADRLGMDPTHLMAVMSFETGGSFSPSERNRYSGATGLIQFIPSTARSLGTSTYALSQMSPERQLDYVEKYLRPYAGRMNTIEDAYMAVLQPVAIGRGRNHQLFRSPSLTYRQNRGLDLNFDGIITVGEASKKVRDRIL